MKSSAKPEALCALEVIALNAAEKRIEALKKREALVESRIKAAHNRVRSAALAGRRDDALNELQNVKVLEALGADNADDLFDWNRLRQRLVDNRDVGGRAFTEKQLNDICGGSLASVLKEKKEPAEITDYDLGKELDAILEANGIKSSGRNTNRRLSSASKEFCDSKAEASSILDTLGGIAEVGPQTINK
jgi:hypothetical protein